MPRANVIQTNFTSGEITPFLYGRVDFAKYFNGARLLSNFVVRPQGGAIRRSGTRYVQSVKDMAKRTIVVPFVFSDIQPYMLEFGHNYMRIYKDRARVESPPGTPIEVTTPWGETDLEQLYFAQSADVLFVCHPSYQTRKISRTSHTSWSLSLYEPTDGPYLSTPQTQRVTATSISDVANAVSSTAIFTASSTKAITNVEAAAGGGAAAIKITAVAHGFVTNDTIVIAGVGGQTEANGTWVITKLTNDTFTLNGSIFNRNQFHAYTSGGTASVPVTSSYVEYREENKWKLGKILQAPTTSTALIDAIDLTLELDPTIKITYTATGTKLTGDKTGTFKLTDVGRYVRSTAGGWYKITAFTDDQNVVVSTLSLVTYTYPTTKVTVTGRTITAKVVSDTNVFASTDVGRAIRMRFLTTWSVGVIYEYVSATTVYINITEELPVDPTNVTQLSLDGVPDVWRLGAWSATTGYPAAVCFHKQRLWFGRTTTEPQTLWGTVDGDFNNMAPTELDSVVLDTSGITFTLASPRANPITWLETGPVLLVGTTGGEWQIKPAAITESLTPTNMEATEQAPYGSVSTYRPLKIGSATLYAQRGGKKLRELVYQFEIDAFSSKDISILSEHSLRAKIVRGCYQKEPFMMCWFQMSDGTLRALTYERDQEVIAWHRHDVGGVVESICCIPSVDGDVDDIYMVVRRTFSGNTKRFIERIDPEFDGVAANQFFVECGLTYTGAPATNISGLDHLNGQTVDVVADGVYIGTKVVSSGSFTLTTAASVVHAGLPSSAKLTTLDPEGGSAIGTSQGKTKRIDTLVIRVKDSMPFKFGNGNTAADTTPTTFTTLSTDDIRVSLDQGFQLTGGFTIEQTKPYALQVMALMPALNTNE